MEGKFETKTFTFCDEVVTVNTTVEDIIGGLINASITRYEVTMAVYDLLGEYITDQKVRTAITDKIKELV